MVYTNNLHTSTEKAKKDNNLPCSNHVVFPKKISGYEKDNVRVIYPMKRKMKLIILNGLLIVIWEGVGLNCAWSRRVLVAKTTPQS